MADNSHLVNGDSREAVAYALFLGIAGHEKKSIYYHGAPTVQADADWVLEMYSRCLKAVSGEKG